MASRCCADHNMLWISVVSVLVRALACYPACVWVHVRVRARVRERVHMRSGREVLSYGDWW